MSKKIDLSTAILDTRIVNSLIVKGEDETDVKLLQHEILININKAAELDIYSDGPVRVKGKKQKSTILTARIDENLDEHMVVIPKMTRKNLCIRINDTVKLYEVEIEDIQEAHGVSMYPIKDTIEGIKGEIYKLFIYPYFKSIPICFVSKDCIYKIKAGITTIECKIIGLTASVNGEIVDVDHARVVQDTEVDSTGEVERSSIEKEYGLIGYDDIGGCRRQMAQIRECIELPLKQPELFSRIGIKPPRGILLHGPPGTGKTLIAKAIANETGAYLHVINGPEIMSKMSGESESNLRKAFETAAQNAPAIIFMDEIDSIAPNREKSSQEAEKRIVSQLLTLMDGMSERSNVIVLGATNRPNSIDPALRRFGRFDREIEIGVPDALGRLEVLGIHTKNMNLADDVDLEAIAKEVHGFTGSDLASLCSEAAIQQIREKLPLIDLDKEKIDAEILNSLKINNDNFRYAIANTDPSSLRETVIETPNVKWSDIGGLEMVKRELKETVQYPVNHPEKYLKFGQNPSKGVLLYGPPGCGKTLLAKAVATECNANFISIKGPELLTKWVGESESNVRNLFDKARGSAPCVLFFDEIDSIGKSRLSASNDGGTTDRVLNQLLAEMDGMNQKKNVFVMGATNRPGQLDSALMRPGRLDQLVYIPLPDEKSRLSILEAKLKNAPVDPQVNLREIADQTDGFSGADMAEICQRTAKLAIRESIEAELRNPELKEDPVPYLTKQHFKEALKNARRSVTKQEIEGFEQFARSMNVELKGDSHDPDDDLYD